MPTYEVTIPGKGIYEVDSPKDLTEMQAYEAALSQAKQEPQKGAAQRTAEIAARGAYPPAAMATAGALMGAPLGPVGAATGALAGGVAIPVSDFLVNLYNLATRSDVKLPSGAISEMLDNLGLAKPESRGERMLEAGAGALTGAGTQIPALTRLATQATSPVVRGVAEQAAQAPVAQTTLSAPSAAIAQYTTEATGSPLAGLAAGLGTSAAGGIRPGRVEPGASKLELTAQAGNLYRSAEKAGLIVKPDYMKQMFSRISQEAKDLGFDEGLHPQVARVLKRLEEDKNSPKTLKEIEILRRIMKAPERQFDNPDQQRIAGNLIDTFDEMVGNIGKQNISSANEKEAISTLNKARDLYAKSRRVGIIEDIVKNAELRASRQSQVGLDNTLRDQFVSLSTNPKRMAAFTQSEKAEIENIAKGGKNLEQMMRFVGRFAIRGPVTGIFGGLGLSLEPVSAGLALGVAEAGKRGAEALRQQNISRLMSQISLGRTPEGRATELLPPTALRGLLSSQYGME